MKTKDRKSESDSGAGVDVVEELLLQALETELGGVEIYRTALKCVQNDDLREEWEEYLEQTEEHLRKLQEVCAELGIDAEADSPGRQVVRHTGKALVQSMLLALGQDEPSAAEIAAAECVTLAETKDHLNWSLIGEVAKSVGGERGRVLARAHEEVEDEEDEHLYHTQGWTRELWLQALGLDAQLPPPEEEQDVKSMRAAARVKDEREQGSSRSTSKTTAQASKAPEEKKGKSPKGQPR